MSSLVWCTAYDTFSAELCEKMNIDTLLVGDSLGMTVYGLKSTQEVTKELMFPHVQAVQRSIKNIPIVVDFPYQSYTNVLQAVETAEYFANAGVHHFKLEGSDENTLSAIFELRARGFEVTGHLGLTPQTISSFSVQGKDILSAEKIFHDAQILTARGISFLVLECVPENLGKKIQELLPIPVIGIGAGRYTKGQILVFDDIVGKTKEEFQPKFLRRFGNLRNEAFEALQKYKSAVQKGDFPAQQEVYS